MKIALYRVVRIHLMQSEYKNRLRMLYVIVILLGCFISVLNLYSIVVYFQDCEAETQITQINMTKYSAIIAKW